VNIKRLDIPFFKGESAGSRKTCLCRLLKNAQMQGARNPEE